MARTEYWVRDLRSGKEVQPLICKVIVDDGQVMLEYKGKGDNKKSILWKDMVFQVEAAINAASMTTSK